ncbi:tetraspanin-15-like [Babylonia areolata]|uniref:tetraspanin-15-like n=1 Tax=Babylonia areolata TaxID=304850 RepID=UPI003FCF12EC
MADSEGMQKMLPETDFSNNKCIRQPLCARTSYSCNKLFLFIYAVLFLFVGIILMAIGVLVETHRQKMESMNNQLAVPVALLILVGMIITLNAVCGLVGTLTENVTLLKVFLVVTIIAFLIQVAIGIIAFIFREEVPEIMAEHVMFAVSSYGEDVPLSRAMDYLQTRYECCGLLSYMDYSKHNKDYDCDSGKPQACGVPSSCCIAQAAKVQPACGYSIVGNLTVSDKVYVVGCINSFMHWLAEHLDLTGAIGLGFAIPQIIGMLLVYYFIRRVNDYQKGYRVGQYFG